MTEPAARPPIERMLRPRSIAIVGASASPGALGAGVLANLERFHYAGDIHLINANRSEINGRPCLKSPAELPDGVDVAVLAIPRAGILDAVKACAARRVGGVVIYAAGFAEAGAEGKALQEEVARIAKANDMAVEGPNCLGYINYVDGVPLTFGATTPGPADARLGIISQSGAMASVLRAALHARGVGVSLSISTGNEALNGAEDFLDYLIDEPTTRLIALMIEQFRRPRRFLELARRARAAGKTIILLHPGRSAAARKSAETHTGAMTGDYAVMHALVSHEGVAVVETLEELVDFSELLTRWPVLPDRGAAIISESGAFKALALDFAETVGLDLPQPSPAQAAELGAIAPDLILPTNPLDLTAQALVDPGLYGKTMKPLLDDPRYGSLVMAIILSNPLMAKRKVQPVVDALLQFKPEKPVLFAMLGEEAEVPAEIVETVRALGVPFLRSPERALRALARVTDFARRRPAATKPTAPRAAKALPSGTIPEYAAKALLAEAGIAVPRGALAKTLSEAKAAAGSVGYPVALKAQAAALSHKSDAGGVVLNLKDERELEAGWAKLHADVARARPGMALDGVLVEGMARPGVELILGARNDPDWGPVLVVGLGGIFAEALHDVLVLPPDLDADAIADEMRKLKGAALLGAFRGQKARDVEAAAAMAAKLGAFVRAHPEIAEIDVNPVAVYPAGEGALALDALIVVR
ncbi:MAG: acetate--CoA ligase family protein [Candidatus Eiseniibacteriota bacterium]